MSEPQVEITVMSDGSIVVIGPEPFAQELKTQLDAFFTARGMTPSSERIEGLKALLLNQDGVVIDRFQ